MNSTARKRGDSTGLPSEVQNRQSTTDQLRRLYRLRLARSFPGPYYQTLVESRPVSHIDRVELSAPLRDLDPILSPDWFGRFAYERQRVHRFRDALTDTGDWRAHTGSNNSGRHFYITLSNALNTFYNSPIEQVTLGCLQHLFAERILRVPPAIDLDARAAAQSLVSSVLAPNLIEVRFDFNRNDGEALLRKVAGSGLFKHRGNSFAITAHGKRFDNVHVKLYDKRQPAARSRPEDFVIRLEAVFRRKLLSDFVPSDLLATPAAVVSTLYPAIVSRLSDVAASSRAKKRAVNAIVRSIAHHRPLVEAIAETRLPVPALETDDGPVSLLTIGGRAGRKPAYF